LNRGRDGRELRERDFPREGDQSDVH
jgi:hypothetical protein